MKHTQNGKRSSKAQNAGAAITDKLAARIKGMSNKEALQFLCDMLLNDDVIAPKRGKGWKADFAIVEREVLQRMADLTDLTDEKQIRKLCDAASYVDGGGDSASVQFHFDGKQAKIVERWGDERLREQNAEDRAFRQQHKMLMRTNPEYRKWWKSAPVVTLPTSAQATIE